MRIHPGIALADTRLTHGALAIGNFDGVHVGHRALFEAARKLAQASAGPSCALTFEPHPARVLAPEYAPKLICSPERKRELLAQAGVEDLIEQPFDRAFMSLSPDAFVELLIATGVSAVVVGHDFTYGRARSGTVESLRRALEERGVRLHVVPPVTVNGLVVSSTKIREFILAGRVEAANMLLGRPFDLDGEVQRGAGRGRKLGWPTANLRTPSELHPAVGVYAVRAGLVPASGQATLWKGAANLGLNPTFRPEDAQGGEAHLLLEVHLLDVDLDLYGQRLRVEFIHRLRDERRFPGVEALKEQIGKDVATARTLLG
jgi:riboflavin kinase/FMN adenylyltransferase